MQIDIRLPNVTSGSVDGRLNQLQSYMYQLVEQLNWALNTVDSATGVTDDGRVVTSNTPSSPARKEKTPQEVFDSIKSLIIKSSDIVDAYYEQMKVGFDGAYLAESDFGTYKELTRQEIDANSSGIAQLLEKTEAVETEITRIRETNAWIKSGELDIEDGIPIYGVEVGQVAMVDGEEVFNKYARFTAGGIYFYLPSMSTPVAWMSNSQLYITNAVVTSSLKIGKYILDTSNGVAFKWMGGN